MGPFVTAWDDRGRLCTCLVQRRDIQTAVGGFYRSPHTRVPVSLFQHPLERCSGSLLCALLCLISRCLCSPPLKKKKTKTLVGFVFVIKRRGGLRICVLKENESESPALGLFFLQIKARVQRGCEYLTRICSCRSPLAVSSFGFISVQYTEQHIERYVSGQLVVQVALIRHATSRFKQEE